MKYTIEGFSQEYALTLRKRTVFKGREREIQIDCTDLVILRWFVDFYPNMRKMTVYGQEYAWVLYKKLLADLPILDVNARGCSERMQKLAEFGILDFRLLKDGGTYTLYAFGPNYMKMIDTNAEGGAVQTATGAAQTATGAAQTATGAAQTATGAAQTATGAAQTASGCCSNSNRGAAQTASKDTSISNTSIRNSSSKKERKKASPESFDSIIKEYTDDGTMQETLGEFLKMRQRIKKPMTNRALELLLKKLDKMGGESTALKVDILNQSILNSWQDVYELKQETARGGKRRAAIPQDEDEHIEDLKKKHGAVGVMV
jgi:hypothetical protein